MSQAHRGSTPPVSRRNFLIAGGAAVAAAQLAPARDVAAAPAAPAAAAHRGKLPEVVGTAHSTIKVAGADKVKLYLWRKRLRNTAAGEGRQGTILFVHGSSISGTPTFDLQVPGRPELSTMDHFARKGYDTWCVDCEGYGHSDKSRAINANVSCGADDLAAASAYIMQATGDKPMVYHLLDGYFSRPAPVYVG